MRTHTREKPYQYTQCGYRGKWKGNLKQHMKSHENQPH